jgi:hypothetical protein
VRRDRSRIRSDRPHSSTSDRRGSGSGAGGSGCAGSGTSAADGSTSGRSGTASTGMVSVAVADRDVALRARGDRAAAARLAAAFDAVRAAPFAPLPFSAAIAGMVVRPHHHPIRWIRAGIRPPASNPWP